MPNLSQLDEGTILSYEEIKWRGSEDKRLSVPGVYAWFFKESFRGIPDKCYIAKPITDGVFFFRDYWRLRYIGKASGQSLKERILDKHFNGSASVSTLRETIGSLLYLKLGLNYVKLVSSYKFDNEEKLTAWMKENARVYYFPTTKASDYENALICKYSVDLYFNLKGKKTPNIFYPLEDLRKNLRNAHTDKDLIKEAFCKYERQSKHWHKQIHRGCPFS